MLNLIKNLSIFVFVFLAFNAQAQLSYGAKVGVRASGIAASSGNPDVNITSIGSYTVGVIAERELSKNFSVMGELNATQRGFAFEIIDPVNPKDMIRFEQKINFVDVPLLLKLKCQSSVFGAYIAAGSSLGIATNSEVKASLIIDGEEVETFEEEAELDEETYSSVNIAAVTALGVNFNIGNSKLFLETRMDYGLNSLIKDDQHLPALGIDFSVGLMLPIGK